MNKSAIEKFAKYARSTLMDLVKQKARYFGITPKEIYPVDSESSDAIVIHGTVHSKEIKTQREKLVNEVQDKGLDQVVEEVAYTWFNRFAALRFMEVNEYLPTGVRVFSSIEEGKVEPDLITHALDVDLPVSKDEIYRLRDAHDEEGLFKYLLIAQCNALNEPLPFLFETIEDYTELLFPDQMLAPDSLIRRLVSDIPEEDWREIEIVGWLYQFYISDKKAQVIGKVVKKEDIPSATQLFTPKWIVQYMVQNSLGRLWLEMHPDSPLRGKMDYYIENPDDKDLKREARSPETLTCMDDACGSGHILVVMFDVLYAIYEEMGYVGREIPSLILKHNLYGIDIDKRAVQLASFAVMMKAREKDRRFLTRGVLPRVIEIQESNGIDLGFLLQLDRKALDAFRNKFKQQDMFEGRKDDDLIDYAVENSKSMTIPQWCKPLQALVDLFLDAKNYGSLLTVDPTLAKKLPEIHTLIDQVTGADLFDEASDLLRKLANQADVLANQYDVCVANPPYMGSKGMNPALKGYAKKLYSNSKSDLFAMFIERSFDLVKESGFSALVTMQSWMFLSSFENLRQNLVKNHTIECMSHMANMVMGIAFGTSATVFRKKSFPRKKGHYNYVAYEDLDEANKPKEFPVQNKRLSWASSEDFNKIPGSPIAYWISNSLRDIFVLPSLSSYLQTRLGLSTANNERFLRFWHEVSIESIGFNFSDKRKAKKAAYKWFPYQKGGAFRKWYGNHEYIVNWYNDGEEIKNFGKDEGKIRSHNYNLDFIFREGITWSDVTSSLNAFRYMPKGYLFDGRGSSGFLKNYNMLNIILSFLNSHISKYLITVINPTVALNVGEIAKLPLPCISDLNSCNLDNYASELARVHKLDWDSTELSWDFENPLLLSLHNQCSLLFNIWETIKVEYNEITLNMNRLEETISRILIEEFSLSKELNPEVPMNEITLTCNPHYRYGSNKSEAELETLLLTDTMKELVSYAIGCMMGRYSIDAQGLVFAGGDWNKRWEQYKARRKEMEKRRQINVANNELLAREEPYEIPEECESWAHSPSFPEDDDGIIPILEEDYFSDDATSRVIEFLKVTFGEEKLNENLQFLAENLLKTKRGESPTQVIRRYLSIQFYKDHLTTYKKRPIYWLFTSGKERAFQALIYMHRYTPSMLAKMRTDYLHELQSKIDSRANHLRQVASTGSSKEKLNAEKQLSKIHKQQAELRKYDALLQHYADQQIEIDLDDGVKVNYLKFEELLETIPNLKKKGD